MSEAALAELRCTYDFRDLSAYDGDLLSLAHVGDAREIRLFEMGRDIEELIDPLHFDDRIIHEVERDSRDNAGDMQSLVSAR